MDEAVLPQKYPGATLDSILRKFGPYRRFLVIAKICRVFFAVLFTKKGLLSKDGRQQFRGKARRSMISLFPPLARRLQKKYGLTGGCTSCSTGMAVIARTCCRARVCRPEV